MDLAKTAVCAGQGTWTNHAIALPASANNNANVRIGFRWVNNNDGTGADPSFAVDDVQITIPYAPTCNGLLVNELSNGPAGAQEYYELLVCGPSCTTLDIRDWKVDDNNGALMNGFGNSLVSSGTAAGHLRFSTAAQWAAVPVGSLIVIHNNTDPNPLMPLDDPTDTAPADSVYILPANHALLQGCGTLPNPASTSNYNSGCVFGAGNFNYISLRNAGDAGQTRLPNGQYYHGISYGSNGNNMNPGGIDVLRISAIDHTGRVLFFNSGDPRLAASFTSAVVAGNETPGAPNNAANTAYINALLCNSLPIELVRFTATALTDLVRTEWTTATEHDNAYFTVERSVGGSTFSAIGTVHGAGNALDARYYSLDDPEPVQGLSYYRLRQTDHDGASALGPVVAVTYNSGPAGARIRPDGTGAWILSGAPGATAWTLLDATGRTLEQGRLSGLPEERIAIRHGAAGWNILLVRSTERVEALRSPVGL